MASDPLPEQDGNVWIAIEDGEIDVEVVRRFVHAPDCGAVVLFLGTVRDHSPGKTGVTGLEYEAYQGVVEDKIREIVDEALVKWPVRRMAAIHAVGTLDVGAVSVAVAASAPHRRDAFDGARYVIDELKTRAPIWKKEHWPGGAEWVQGS